MRRLFLLNYINLRPAMKRKLNWLHHCFFVCTCAINIWAFLECILSVFSRGNSSVLKMGNVMIWAFCKCQSAVMTHTHTHTHSSASFCTQMFSYLDSTDSVETHLALRLQTHTTVVTMMMTATKTRTTIRIIHLVSVTNNN